MKDETHRAEELERLRALEAQAARMRADLGLPPPEPDAELAKRLSFYAEAERIAGVGSWSWVLETAEVRWSEGLFRIFGLDPQRDRPCVESFFAVIHPDDFERVKEASARAVHEQQPARVECRIRRQDGAVRDIVMDGARSVNADGRVCIIGALLDVTERKQLETQVRASLRMEALGKLAGGVAHDVNNYLQVMGVAADLTRRSLPADHPGRVALNDLDNAVNRCAALVESLLAFGRRQAVAPRVLDLGAQIAASETLLRRVVGKAVSLEVAHGAAHCAVSIDPLQLEQVLLNLVLNARDAMPKGGEVRISTRRLAADELPEHARSGPHVELCVEDSGIGIAEEVLPHIFEPYFTTKGERGTGLGLSTVYGIVRQNGGQIRVESQRGKGSVFRVLLPAVDDAERALGAEAVGAHSPRARILVVDDNLDVRRTLRLALEQDGFEILEASDGADALALLTPATTGIDLVISDVRMPRIGGVELVKRSRALRPDLPFLLISGYAESFDQIDVPLLSKPFSAQELSRHVRAALGSLAV